jgi:hypothetical protein
MYYTMKNADSCQIRYANSSDGIVWTDGGMILKSDTSKASSNRRWEINGPSVLKINATQYRMYYCATPYYHNTPPSFHLRSAISNDGTSFTDEGIRIDISPNDPASVLSLAGHGTFFINDSGSVTAIFSANAAGQLTHPSDLYKASSVDGLAFSGFVKLYTGWHDPIVVKKSNKYRIYAVEMLNKEGTAESDDGMTWPNRMDSISLQDSLGKCFTESGDGIGDIGGITTAANETFLYTNFGAPSKDIALFRLSNPSVSIKKPVKIKGTGYRLFSGSFSGNPRIEFGYSKDIVFTLTDLQGKLIDKRAFHDMDGIRLAGYGYLRNGIYLFTIETKGQIITGKIIKE